MHTARTYFSFLRRFFVRWYVVFGLLLAVAASSWSLLIPGLGTGHDLNHQARMYEMATGLREGVFPVIWSQNLGYGYGMPLFEFYAPLPYYLGALVYLAVGNLTLAVKLLILLVNIATVIFAFNLGKILFSQKASGVLVAIAIAVAPYRAVDIYVRAALSEAWAIAFILLVLWGIVAVARKERLGWLLVTCGFAGVVLSHNLTALLAVPFFGLFGLAFVLLQTPDVRSRIMALMQLAGAGLLGLGLASFYVLPAVAEKQFTQVDTFTLSAYYDFRQHFLYIRQFLEPWGEWEYGGSGWGPNDEMSFFLGFGQLIVVASAVLLMGVWTVKQRGKVFASKQYMLHILLLGLGTIALLLTLLKTQFLWQLVPFAQYVQFPWRFLAIALVFLGLLVGSTELLLPTKMKKPFAFTLIAIFIICNARYFRSEKYHDHSQSYAKIRDVIRTENSSNLFDYLPKDLDFFEKQGFYLHKKSAVSGIDVPTQSILLPATGSMQSDSTATVLQETSTYKKIAFNSTSAGTQQVALAAYPGWLIEIDGAEVPSFSGAHGLLSFTLPSGGHTVSISLQDTQIRRFGKIVSGISVLILVMVWKARQITNCVLQLKRRHE